MVSYNRNDLEFILQQIKLSEAHAAGTPLTDLIPNPLLPWGVRTVDGTLNNIIAGRETWGSADQPFPRLTDYSSREGTAPTTPFSPGGPFPITNTDYSLTGSVVDTAPRTISNLIVDQTLNNPAAIRAALKFAGFEGEVAHQAQLAITAAWQAVQNPPDNSGLITALSEALAAQGELDAARDALQLLVTGLFDGSVDPADDASADAARAAATAANTAAAAVVTALSTQSGVDPALITQAQNVANAAAALAAAVDAFIDDGLSTADLSAAFNAFLASQALAGITTAGGSSDALVAALQAAQPSDPQIALNALLDQYSIELTANGSLVIPNVAPDEGISAPFNSWMTLFGQFFDHGLDLVEKTSNSRVYIPLQPDDPHYVAGGNSNFMVITRTTPDARNLTTPFVDQNQTYTSHASHQVFLREYMKWDHDGDAGTAAKIIATGHLLEGAGGGLATWADVKAQAIEMLGLQLDDRHVHEVPLLATDLYGMFERAPNGYAMVVVTVSLSDGSNATARASGKEGGLDLLNITEADLIGFTAPTGVTVTGIAAMGTGHAFLDDIAHTAAPAFVDPDRNPFTNNSIWTTPDADSDIGNGFTGQVVNALGVRLTYDNELLDRHFITGDGRGNENIGLTAVHHVFHSEHNRMAEHTKGVVLASGDVAFLNEWLLVPVTEIPADPSTLVWNGERLFQAARFGTEMQYQHLVFEEFARKVNPMVDLFVFNPTMDINPAIFAEFAHVVYRFGHSMLNETVDRLGADGQTADDIGLIQAFLNPVAFNQLNGVTVSDDVAAGAIIRGMTRQQGNEIDEFVTEALRNNLLGLPLDLATINIARGRETGMPTLQEAREQFFEMTRSQWLKPYENWVDFALNLKNPASVINFIAAYGTHESITDAVTFQEKRDAATLLVFGGAGAPADRLAFLNATGAWAGGSLGGLNDVDLWIGGLAEAILPFGGMLGSTFTFVFEMQMENLQNGDRFYYLSRTQGLNFLTELENNAFSKIIMKNTDLGAPGSTHLPGEIFSTPDYILEVNQALQNQPDPEHDDPLLAALSPKVVRDVNVVIDGTAYANYLKFTGGEHVVLGGTDQDDVLIGDLGDDTLWGDGGNDLIIGGHGINRLHGGDGDDIIFGGGDPEFLHGEDGNDVIHGGNGLGDLIFGGKGQDFIIAGIDGKEVFGGQGNDFILGTPDMDFLLGGEGDDWIEGGEGFDTIAGDNSELFFNSSVIGHDVMFAGTNENDFDAESGDDIMVQGESVMRNEGMLGFDWVTFQEHKNFGVTVDMNVKIFTTVFDDILRNRFDRVEALSGSIFGDTIIGDSRIAPGGPVNPAIPVNEQTLEGDELNRDGVERISGLHRILGYNDIIALREAFPLGSSVVFNAGNILLGNGGSDIIEGRGGDDIIDGDAALQVRIGIVDANGAEIGTAFKMQGAVHFYTAEEAAALNAAADALGQPKLHAAASTQLLAREGQPLDQLMFDRGLNPGNLRIVREIVDGGQAGDIDIASFRGALAEYTIRDANGNVLSSPDNPINLNVSLDLSGPITVEHTLGDPRANGINHDGTDTLRNIEALRFADATILASGITNGRPTGNLAIIDPTPAILEAGDVLTVELGTIADPDGLPPIARFTFTWQVEETPGAGDWVNLEDPNTDAVITGRTLTLSPTLAAEIEGLRLRVIGSYRDGNGVPEVVFSEPTRPFGVVGNVAPTVVPIVLDPVLEADAPDPITITRAQLLAGVFDPDTPLSSLSIVGLIADKGDLVETIPEQEWSFTPPANDGSLVTFSFAVSDGTNLVPNTATLDLINVNDLPVSTLAISDTTPTNNDTLSLIGTITDADGMTNAVLAYQWQSSLDGVTWTNIGGADEATFRPRDGQVGQMLRTIVTYTDDEGTTETVITPPTQPVGDVIRGTNGADTIVGTAGADIIDARNGNDVLTGLAGNDTLNGGGGTDTAVFVSAVTSATFALEGGNVVVTTPAEGSDTLINIETLRFEGINYTLRAGTNANNNATGQFNGGAGNDIILGFGGNDTLNGNNGNDVLVGGTGNDTINGGAGADIILWNAGDGRDRINGGAGTDTVVINGDTSDETFRIYTRSEAISQGVVTAAQILASTQIVITRNGTNNASVITELNNTEEIVINGGGGNNQYLTFGDFTGTSLSFNTITIIGGNGNDTVDITGQRSPHRVVFHSGGGNDTFRGFRSQDAIITALAALSDDNWTSNNNGTKTKSDGNSSITIDNTSSAQIVSATAKVATNPHVGTDQSETIRGTNRADLIEGRDGHDVLYGYAGDDIMKGDDGNDVLYGQAGHDKMYGGTGNDTMYGGDGNDVLYGQDGNDTMYGGAGNDTMYGGDGNDVLYGQAGNDTMYGGAGNDTMYGGDGNDVLYGQAGNDTIYGGAGNDTIYGGDGNDVLDGQAGNDKLVGGKGNDTYVVSLGNDTIVLTRKFGNDVATGFDANPRGGQDRIDISELGITKSTFKQFVEIKDLGKDTLVTIKGEDGGSLLLKGVNGNGLNVITIDDFLLA